MKCLAVLLVTCALAGAAFANGRDPGTSSITFELGDESKIVAGVTFGVVESHDGGVTWRWMCENAVGYGGVYPCSSAQKDPTMSRKIRP